MLVQRETKDFYVVDKYKEGFDVITCIILCLLLNIIGLIIAKFICKGKDIIFIRSVDGTDVRKYRTNELNYYTFDLNQIIQVEAIVTLEDYIKTVSFNYYYLYHDHDNNNEEKKIIIGSKILKRLK